MSQGDNPSWVEKKWDEFCEILSSILGGRDDSSGAGAAVTDEEFPPADCRDISYTKHVIVEPLLKFLGYKYRGTDGGPDYLIRAENGDVLVRVVPVCEVVSKNGEDSRLVSKWLEGRLFNTDTGILTNGRKWVLFHYDEVSGRVRIFAEVDLGGVLRGNMDEKKRIFSEFYSTFSREHVEKYVRERISQIRSRREDVAREFYRGLIYRAFGYVEVRTKKNRVRLIKKTEKNLYDSVRAPSETTPEEKRRFVVSLINLLMFMKFLENKGLLPRGILRTSLEEWRKTKSEAGCYRSHLELIVSQALGRSPFGEDAGWDGEYWVGDDSAIERLVEFLDGYSFTFDDGVDEKSLSPDVMGYVYEKLINLLTSEGQRGLGAYYTPDSITVFMARETIEALVVEKLKELLAERGMLELASFSSLDEALDPLGPLAGERTILRTLLSKLDSIKILDPAVGSGHFLISSLKVMSRIHKRLHYLIGESADPYRVKLKVILNNLYGVDIDEAAVEVARLRLWLALIEDISAEEVRAGRVTLPPLEYNMRVGNSLVGWVHERLTTPTLDAIYSGGAVEELRKLRASAAGNLAESLSEAERLLRLPLGSLRDRIRIYLILRDAYLRGGASGSGDLKRILATLHGMIYRWVDGAYLRQIKGSPAMPRGIKGKIGGIEDFRRAFNPFHWAIDFGDVMAAGGFDIVIGNPPYGGQVSELEKHLNDPEGITSKKNIAKLFILRSFLLVKDGGYVSLIVPKSLTYASDWSGLRTFLEDTLMGLYDVKEAFKDVLLEQVIFVARKGHSFAEYSTGDPFGNGPTISIPKDAIPVDTWICDVTPEELRVIRGISSRSRGSFGDLILTYRGLNLQRYVTAEGEIQVIGGKNIGAYRLKGRLPHLDPAKLPPRYKGLLRRYQKPKVVFQNIVAFVSNPVPHLKVMGAYDELGRVPLDTVNVVEPRDERMPHEFVLGFMNSLFFNWMLHIFAFNRAVRTMHLDNYALSKIPVPEIDWDAVGDISGAVRDMLEEGFAVDTYFWIEDRILEWYGVTEGDLPASYRRLREHYMEVGGY